MASKGQDSSRVLVNELKNDFNVKHVDGRGQDRRRRHRAGIIHPREISGERQFAIDQFILRGGKLIAFLDPVPPIDSQKSQNQMAAISQQRLHHGQAKAWGIGFDTTKVVGDLNPKITGGRNGQP